MQTSARLFDTSSELIIQKHNNGIKLIKPEKIKTLTQAEIPGGEINYYTLGKVFEFPFNVYFMNQESRMINLNEASIKALKLDSLKKVIGKTGCEISKTKHNDSILHDQVVLRTKKMTIFEEHLVRIDNVPLKALSVKLPWFDEDNNAIGIFGCTFMNEEISGGPLSHFLSVISEYGLFNTSPAPLYTRELSPRLILGEIRFSKRESDCIRHLLQGLGIKEIANELGISPNTAAQYLVNIKYKLGVRYKSQVIKKVSYFLGQHLI